MRRRQFSYITQVIKQGNSLCVRIPHFVKKELGIIEGVEVEVSVRRTRHEATQEDIEQLLQTVNKTGKWKRLSEEKKRLFVSLNFRFVQHMTDEPATTQADFINELRQEFGNQLIDEWLKFEKSLNKELFRTDKEGFNILKEKYY